MAALACKKKLYDKFSDINTDDLQNNRQQHIIDERHISLSYNFFSPLFFTLPLRRKQGDQDADPATGNLPTGPARCTNVATFEGDSLPKSALTGVKKNRPGKGS